MIKNKDIPKDIYKEYVKYCDLHKVINGRTLTIFVSEAAEKIAEYYVNGVLFPPNYNVAAAWIRFAGMLVHDSQTANRYGEHITQDRVKYLSWLWRTNKREYIKQLPSPVEYFTMAYRKKDDREKVSDKHYVYLHVSFNIDYILGMEDAKIAKMLNHDGSKYTGKIYRRVLNKMLTEGQTVITSGECDNFNPVYGCMGHLKEREVK